MLLYSLKFAWWNVSLSPAASSATSKGSAENYKMVCEHIKHLIVDKGCHCIGICEVSEADINEIEMYFDDLDYEVIGLTFSVGKTRFDTAIIFDRSRLRVEYLSQISSTSTGQTIKAGQLLNVMDIKSSKPFKLVLCHWPSRLRGDGVEKRMKAANLVKMTIDEFIEHDDVIVMGDFNDNPFDDSVFKNLNAIKCLETVRLYPTEFLYNPFGHSIHSQTKYNHLLKEQAEFRFGTIKYKTLSSFWHSYDQIMVSGSLLGGSNWHLNEQGTEVISTDAFINLINDKRSIIDHLPVVCEINRP